MVFAKSHLLSPKELKHNLYLTECVLGKAFFWHESTVFCRSFAQVTNVGAPGQIIVYCNTQYFVITTLSYLLVTNGKVRRW